MLINFLLLIIYSNIIFLLVLSNFSTSDSNCKYIWFFSPSCPKESVLLWFYSPFKKISILPSYRIYSMYGLWVHSSILSDSLLFLRLDPSTSTIKNLVALCLIYTEKHGNFFCAFHKILAGLCILSIQMIKDLTYVFLERLCMYAKPQSPQNSNFCLATNKQCPKPLILLQ